MIAHIISWRTKGKTLTGEVFRARDFLFGYQLTLDATRKQVEVRKRNWFVFGTDSKAFNFGQVRNVLVDEHLITASIEVRVYAGNISAHWFKKADAKAFRDALMSINAKGDSVGIFLE